MTTHEFCGAICVRVRPVLCATGAMIAAFACTGVLLSDDRPRLLVLTDIGGDPDDQQSLIRLLVHANEFEIEGLIASASGTPGEVKERVTRTDLILQQIEAYADVVGNLQRHAPAFPAAESLASVVRSGNPHRGREAIGDGHDTEGSRWIIACGDRPGARPLNIAVWGGQTDLAQAMWRVRQERGTDGFRDWADRLRVFDISDQDRIHDWMFEQFPDVFYVLAQAPPGADKREGAYRGMYLGGDESLTSGDWVDVNVRVGHGALGALYPVKTWTAPNPHGVLKEGDTPSWFCFLETGLNDPEHPEWGGWGGRYRHEQGGLYRDAADSVAGQSSGRATVFRWRPAFQNEFAARMDWCVCDNPGDANHPPSVMLNDSSGTGVLNISAVTGETVRLTSRGSSDPDSDELSARWSYYPEAGTFAGAFPPLDQGDEAVSVTVPADAAGTSLHVILEVMDSGTPPLTRYRRAVISVSGDRRN